MKKLFLALVMLGLTGCASVGQDGQPVAGPLDELRAVAKVDLAAAAARAESRDPVKDPGAQYRARCFRTLEKFATDTSKDSLLSLPEPKGVADALEIAMEKVIDVKAAAGVAIPEEISANCDYVVGELRRAGMRGAAKAGADLVPGGGLLRGLLR